MQKTITEFVVGESVFITNDNNVKLRGMREITKIEIIDGETRYFVVPSDTPWSPWHKLNLNAKGF